MTDAVVRDVHGDRPGAPGTVGPPAAGGCSAAPVGVDVGEDHVAAGLRKAAGDLEPEALGGAGDERDATAEAPDSRPKAAAPRR